MGAGEKHYIAEIISIDLPFIFVHFVGFNKRLDELVHVNKADLSKVEVRKKKMDDFYPKNIKLLHFNNNEVEPWYFSPYPARFKNNEMFICKFCLFFLDREEFISHDCNIRHPPGKEIWRNKKAGECTDCEGKAPSAICPNNTCRNGEVHSFFEINGTKHKNYCRNLALLSKLFLDHKTLYYDVDSFMFYVLCRLERDGFVIVGYFSKEKISLLNYNLACVLVLPFEQRKGYGKMAIDFSYVLSNRTRRIETCEKPFSDLGLLGYLSFWKDAILDFLVNGNKVGCEEQVIRKESDSDDIIKEKRRKELVPFHEKIGVQKASIHKISLGTGIKKEDIIHTLVHYKLIKIFDSKIIFYVPEKYKRKLKITNRGLFWKGNKFNFGELRHI